jgi:hypothetical protein
MPSSEFSIDRSDLPQHTTSHAAVSAFRLGAVSGSLMLVERVLTLGLVPARTPAVEVAGGRRAELLCGPVTGARSSP